MVHIATSEQREIVFLLGAGATKDAGLPTATELTGCVEKAIEREYPSLLPALRFIQGAIQFGKACQAEPLTNSVNIEEVLMACSFLAQRGERLEYPFVGAWHERINSLQPLPQEIRTSQITDSFQFLSDFCKSRLRDWLAIKDPAALMYLWGFRKFTNAGYRLRIFTLNYDEGIERALKDAGMTWTNGFGENGWDPGLLDSDGWEVYLYKLHGSLDWVKDEKLGICSVKWPSARDSEELPDDFEPLLIFGTDAKLQAVDPFLTLLFRFQQLLTAVGVLVVIGYSFGDAHVNDIILEALQRDPQMRCIVVNLKGLDELLSPDSDFQRKVGLEQRFVSIPITAKEALESDRLLDEVESVFKAQKEELPF